MSMIRAADGLCCGLLMGQWLKRIFVRFLSFGVMLCCSRKILTDSAKVLGCDGIHSHTRQLLLGDDSPAAHASFTHQLGYGAVLPISGAIEVLGDAKGGSEFCIHVGPNAYVPSYPVRYPITIADTLC